MKRFNQTAFSITILTLLALMIVEPVFAHPGNTASDGCHYCRTNCDKWGVPWNERHCHGGSKVSAPVYIQPTNTPRPLPTWTPKSLPTATPTLSPTETPAPTTTPETPTPTPAVLGTTTDNSASGGFVAVVLGALIVIWRAMTLGWPFNKLFKERHG